MIAEHIARNRLERAKLAIGDSLEDLEGDRMRLFTFAGLPVKKCPLTVNYSSFKRSLDAVGVEPARILPEGRRWRPPPPPRAVA